MLENTFYSCCQLSLSFNFYFYFILLYSTVLVLPYIDMNPPRVYMSSQIWTPPSHLSPHIISLDHPRAPAPSILYPASNIDWRFVSYMIVYMFQCHSPSQLSLNGPLWQWDEAGLQGLPEQCWECKQPCAEMSLAWGVREGITENSRSQ